MRLVFAFFLGIFFMVAALGSGFEPRGKFVGPDLERVMAFDAGAHSTWDEIEDLALRLPHTEGQMTVAVIYPGGGAPTKQLSDAKDFIAAVGTIYAGPAAWRYRVDIDTNGAIQITDCESAGESGMLCSGRGETRMAQSLPGTPAMAQAAAHRPFN